MTKLKSLEIEDLTKYVAIENLQYSPSGDYLAFQTGKADVKKNGYHRDVWLVKDGVANQFTASFDTSFVLWEDDTHFLVKRTIETDVPGTTTFYKLAVDGGEAQLYLTLPYIVTSIKKVNDTTYVSTGIIDSNEPDLYKLDAESRKKKQEEKEADKDYQIIDEVPYWMNGQGFTNKLRTALFIIDMKDGVHIKRITSPSFNVEGVCVDKNVVYYTGNVLTPKSILYSKVYSYDVKQKKVSTVYGKNTHSIHNLFVFNKHLYAQASDMKEYGVNETGDICIIDKNEITHVIDPERQLMDAVAGDTYLGGGKQNAVNGNHFITLATEGDHVEIWSYDKKFKKDVLFNEQGTVFCLDSKNNKIAFIRSDSKSLQEVYEMNLDDRSVQQITSINTEVLKGKYVAKPNVIEYTSEGLNLKGWVLLPQNFDKKKKYPAVLDVHGGPRGIYSNMFFHEMQVWASKGYVVFFTNIKGSDGRDDAFADIRGDYGGCDFRNLMDFTDAVIKKYPNIDTTKICETGGSYGGFMTNWIIGHTDRFCCAASQRSISNWISFSFISDIGLYFGPDQCGSHGLYEEDDFKQMWEHSPLKYAKNVKTPTLFIHSDEDYRCPLPEGMQMMQALAFNGVETRMCIFHGENHELSRSGKPLHRIKRLTEITNWFEKHTK